MGKPLAGAKYFEAMGRRHVSKDLVAMIWRNRYRKWPTWAQEAYLRGRIGQKVCPPLNMLTKSTTP